MPVTIKDFRIAFPQYDDMNDTALTGALHRKYYSDLPFEEVSEVFGLKVEEPGFGVDEIDFGIDIDETDPLFKLTQKIRDADSKVIKDFLGFGETKVEAKPRDILRASRDEDIDFIKQATINDPTAVPVSVGKLIDREQKVRQEMKSLSQETPAAQNIVFAVSNWTNLFNVNEYLDRQGLNPFSKGQYAITLEAVNRLVAQRPLSAKDVALEFGVHAPKILLEFAALPDVGSKIKMLEKTPRLRKILSTGLKFATRAAVQAPSVEETLAERAKSVLGAGGFGVAVGAAGEFIPTTAIRAPITIGGAGLLTLAQGGSKEDVIKTMSMIAGFEALGLIKRASRATDVRIRKRLETKAIKAIRQGGKAKGLDLSKVPEEALRFYVKSRKQAEFWQRQFKKGKITKSVLEQRLGEQADRIRPVLEAIARQQPAQPTPEAAAVAERAKVGPEGIKLPPEPTEAKITPKVAPVGKIDNKRINEQLARGMAEIKPIIVRDKGQVYRAYIKDFAGEMQLVGEFDSLRKARQAIIPAQDAQLEQMRKPVAPVAEGKQPWEMTDSQFKEGGWADFPKTVLLPSEYKAIAKNEGEQARDLVYELNLANIETLDTHRTDDGVVIHIPPKALDQAQPFIDKHNASIRTEKIGHYLTVKPTPTPVAEGKVLPEELEPLAKEARRFKTTEQFFKIDRDIREQALFGQMEERRLSESPDKAFILKENNIPVDAEATTVFRASPEPIRPGDFVGLNKKTAELHKRTKADKIFQKEVDISDLIQGVDQFEVIYAPKETVKALQKAGFKNLQEFFEQVKAPTPSALERKPIKEIKHEKEAITEPITGPQVEPEKAGELVPTGKLDPTNPEEALKITQRHAKWLAQGGDITVGGIFETKWEAGKGELEKGSFVVSSVEYTPEQIDTAYRTVQKPVPSPMPDTELFAMPGKEAEIQAIAQKMSKIKPVTRKVKKVVRLTKPGGLPKAKTEKTDHIKAVYKATSKEETRYAINGVKVEGDTIIATDGRRMFWAKDKWGKDGLYINPASLKNGLLGKPTKTELKFPDWHAIVPDVSGEKPILVGDLDTVWRNVRQAALITTEESRGIIIIDNKDGTLGFAAASPEVGHAEVNIRPGGKILGAVNPQFLLDALSFHAIRGNDSFEFYFPDWRRPMLTKSLDGKTNTLTMPINVGDKGPMSEAIAEAIAEGKPGEYVPKAKKQPEAIQKAKNKAQVTGKTQKIIKEGKEVDVIPDEDVSIVEDPGTLGAAETIPKIDASLEPKGKPVSARDVIFQMERDFGVPFRSKVTHIFKKKIAHFQIKSKVIRAIDVRDLSTATHELGHHLDHNFFGNIRKHPPPGANQELLELGKALYGKRKPPGGYKSEGVAEYMRLWLTDNDAENRAPYFTKWFEKYLKDNPDVAKRLRRTRKLIEKWKAQGAVSRIESQIVTGKVRGTINDQLQDAVRILETLLLDRFAPLRRLRDEIGAAQFAPSEDPFVVATANATKAGAKAAFFALEGTTDLAGIINGISLQEALAPVSRDIKNWQTWAVAARAMHLHKLGINPGISKTDANFVFEQFKTPDFEKALDEFTKWNHRGLDYMVEAGAIEKSVADRIKKRHPVYVPFKRAFKEGEIQLKFVPTKGFVETGSPIKKIKGSGRAIKDPIQEAMLGMEAMISTAQKAQVALAMAKLADRFPGVGKFIVRIPAPQVPTTFSAEQIKGDILKIAVQRLGIDPTEINVAQLMDTWDEDLTVFTKGFKFTGKENVISIVRNDKRLFYELSPDLFKTLKGLDKFTLPWYLDFWMGRANRALKLGATGVNPTFALRNFIRDLQTFGFTTEFARGNFLAGVKGIGKDVATDFSGIAEKFGVKIPKSQDVLKFRALGGELATFILQDKTGVKHLKSTVLASDGTKYVVNTFLHPIHLLRELVGITEVGTRIGEFGPALREGERRYGKDTADAAMFALNAAQDVTVNFSRMGTLFQILNQIIPFSNVAVQGPAKIFRTIRKRPLRSIRRAMIGLMIPAIWLWWRNKDKKWWKSLPTHEKGNYLHFENPKDPNEIFRFPIAFELGHIFQTIPVMALDAMYQNDPSDVDDMLGFVLEQANPIDWPAAVGPLIDVKENLDFAGRPIVPRSVEGRLPEDRFTTRSTTLMKFIGRKLKISPAQLDYLANTYSGGVYGRTARLLSSVTEAPETKSDLPIIGTLFLRDPFAPRKEIEKFYNKLELLSQKNQSKKITKEEHREFIIRGRIARAISPQWRLLRDSKTIKQRKTIYGKIENAIIKGDEAIDR